MRGIGAKEAVQRLDCRVVLPTLELGECHVQHRLFGMSTERIADSQVAIELYSRGVILRIQGTAGVFVKLFGTGAVLALLFAAAALQAKHSQQKNYPNRSHRIRIRRVRDAMIMLLRLKLHSVELRAGHS